MARHVKALSDLHPIDDETKCVIVVIETARGSRTTKAVTDQIEHFFIRYNEQEGKRFQPKGRHGRKRAEEVFAGGRREYRRKSKSK